MLIIWLSLRLINRWKDKSLSYLGKVVPARNALPYLRRGYPAGAVWGISSPGGKTLNKETEGVRALEGQRRLGNYTMWPALNTWR